MIQYISWKSHAGSQNQRWASGFLWFKGLSKTCALATILTWLGRWAVEHLLWHLHTLEQIDVNDVFLGSSSWFSAGKSSYLGGLVVWLWTLWRTVQALSVLIIREDAGTLSILEPCKLVRCRTDMKPSTNSRHLWIHHVACGVWMSSAWPSP